MSPAASSALSVLSEEYPSPGSLTRSLDGCPPIPVQLAMATGGDQRPEEEDRKEGDGEGDEPLACSQL